MPRERRIASWLVSVKFEANVRTRPIKKAWKEVSKAAARGASVSALNKAMAEEKKPVRKQIAADAGVNLNQIPKWKEKVFKAKAKNVATALYFNHTALRWPDIKVTPLKRGGVKFNKSVTYKSAFFARMPSGHEGYFQRRGPKATPIDELKIIIKPWVEKAIASALRRMKPRFDQEFPGYLKKREAAIMKAALKREQKRLAAKKG